MRWGQAQLDGSTTFLTAVDPAGLDRSIELTWASGSADGLDGDGVIVDEATADSRGWAVGDPVEVLTIDGRQLDLAVSGVFESNQVVGSTVVSLDTLADTGAPPLDRFLYVDLADGVAADDVRPALEEVLSAYPVVDLKDQTEFQDEQKGQVDQLLLLINAMLVLSVVIAALGIVNTLAMSVIERTREVGLLRAVGLGRAQLRRMIRLEAVVISVYGAVLGLVLGTLFGVALSRSLADQGISELAVPVPRMAIFLLVAGVIGVLAAVVPGAAGGPAPGPRRDRPGMTGRLPATGAGGRVDAVPGADRARGVEVLPFPSGRRAVTAAVRAGRRIVPMHGLLEVDVSDTGRRLAEHHPPLSMTAFVIAAVARTAALHPEVHAYRDWRGRLVRHRHVDVQTIVEVPTAQGPFGLVHVVRDADVRSVAEITAELRDARADMTTGPARGRQRLLRVAGTVPGFFPLLYAGMTRSVRAHRLTGTAQVTAVGMFAGGGGFAIAPPTLASLLVVVGGCSRRPRVVGEEVVARDVLDLTVTVDHNVVDGAPATRFGAALRRLMEAPADDLGLGLGS